MRAFIVGKSKSRNKKATLTDSSCQSETTSERSQSSDVLSPTPSSSNDTETVPTLSSRSQSESTEENILLSELSMTSEEQSNNSDPAARLGFKVLVRIKPLEDQTVEGGQINRLRCVQVKGAQNLVLCTRPSLKKENAGNKHWFKFDHVLDEISTQKDAYDISTQPLVDMTLQGYHSCLITYGSPGSGKSHALFGKASSGKHKGLIIRAAEAIMGSIDKASPSTRKTAVSMSFVQIYNEKLYDILDPSATDHIKFHDVGDVHTLEGVTEWPIETTEDVTKQLRRNPNRLQDAGRSHTIFTLYFRKEEELENETDPTEKSFRTTEGKLDFVDLAGVNRSTKHSTYDSTGNNATAKANRSLQVFSKVIMALTDIDNTHTPPYRDSRLTRLLREALGGNCVTRLLVTASSCPNSAHETLNCLHFAKRSMSVQNFPAPYVSVESIKEEIMKEIPPDDVAEAVVHENSVDVDRSLHCDSASPVVSSLEGSPVSKSSEFVVENTIAMVAISLPNAAEKPSHSSTLPPINVRNPVLSNPLFADSFDALSARVPSSKSGLEAQAEHDQSISKQNRNNRRLSKDVLDVEGNENKRKMEKPKKAKGKKKYKDKVPDQSASVSSSQYWPLVVANPEITNGGNVVPLPQIETPDQVRRELSHHDTPLLQEGRSRKKNTVRKQSPRSEVAASSGAHSSVPKEHTMLSQTTMVGSDELLATTQRTCSGVNELAERREAFCVQSTSSKECVTSSPVVTSSNCCVSCMERENKIKRDYDRMIVFSKKDRDVKQNRIEELEVMLRKAHNDSASLAELKRLGEEGTKDRQLLKKQAEQLESYKAQLTAMVSTSDFASLKELRKKDTTTIEDLKTQIEGLKKNLEEQTIGASKMLSKKSEQIEQLSKEIEDLKQRAISTEKTHQGTIERLQTSLNQANTEKETTASKHQSNVKEISLKLTCALAQVSQLQETQVDVQKQHEAEKETWNREMSILSKQVADLSKSKKKHDDKSKLKIVLKCDSSTNTENIRSQLNGFAYSVQCLRCAAQANLEEEQTEEVTSLRDAELRIMLIQDAKNRELLLQLKRERNLLRDVMKIMYCRQWFTEEGSPHVKRTLRRVGIDTRELAALKKY